MAAVKDQWTKNEAQACWADGGLGHDHVREVLGSLVHITYHADPEIYDLVTALNAPMSDDASEEDDALELLNAACEDGIYWALDNGDLILFKEGDEDVWMPTRHSTS